MKKILLLMAVFLGAAASVSAERMWEQTPEYDKEYKLTVPELEPKLVYTPQPAVRPELMVSMPAAVELADNYHWSWMDSKPGVRPYTVMEDLTFVGVPVFIAGIAIKGDKANFRQDYNNTHANTRLLTTFKTSIDDYTQYFGPAMTLGLKLGGVEGRSSWGRFGASAAMSYGIMAALVNGIKYTAKEMRPDGSQANSWPSGHTATSFVGASILHKEYGLTRSPWYSIAGYSVATATGIMRILNNRHWISDVLSGAGIGIMSTEAAYALSDIIFKERGLLRNDKISTGDNPSFFAISMGMGFGLDNLSFTNADLSYEEDRTSLEDNESFSVDFHTASVVDIEGAYFINKYIGFGGRLRVRAMTAKSWSDFVDNARADREELETELFDIFDRFSPVSPADIRKKMGGMLTDEEYTIESDHLTEFSANVGLYFNLPIARNLSLGSKLLIGRSLTQELDINAHYKGEVKNVAYNIQIADGYKDETKNFASLKVDEFESSGETYDAEWDYLTLGGNNSTNFGTGLSLTYRYKSNFSWRLFCDYDYSKKQYTFVEDPLRYLKHASPTTTNLLELIGNNLDPMYYKKTKHTHFFTIGASFAVTF